jgi:hypothetical protein
MVWRMATRGAVIFQPLTAYKFGEENIQYTGVFTLTIGGVVMWRHYTLMVLLLVTMVLGGCSLDPTPKRMRAYLPPPDPSTPPAEEIKRLKGEGISAVLVMVNDTDFKRSAPALRKSTVYRLGEHLKAEVEKHFPLRFPVLTIAEDLMPKDSVDYFMYLAKEQELPYVMVAVISSTERETFEYFPMMATHGGGLRSFGMPGYRTENHARMELALLDAQTGQAVLTTDGQAWAVLERLQVPMKSNVFPVVRRDVLQPPIYPKSEEDAYETLMWVSGLEAIAQTVMRLEEPWRKHHAASVTEGSLSLPVPQSGREALGLHASAQR